MTSVNVVLSDECMASIDAEAASSNTNREELVRRAVEEWVTAKRRAREEDEARRRFDAARDRLDALATKLGSWDAMRVVREFRHRGSAPRTSR